MEEFRAASLYLKMARPFPTEQAAELAIHGFLEDLKVAREKHRIANALLVASVNIEGLGECIVPGFVGDASQQLPLASFLVGWAKSRHDRLMAALIKDGAKKAS
jgi:hypothetical protein